MLLGFLFIGWGVLEMSLFLKDRKLGIQDAALASGAVVVDALFWIVLGIFGVIYS